VHVQAASSLSIVFGEKVNKTKVCTLVLFDVISVRVDSLVHVLSGFSGAILCYSILWSR
jgi:hypothetical protein